MTSDSYGNLCTVNAEVHDGDSKPLGVSLKFTDSVWERLNLILRRRAAFGGSVACSPHCPVAVPSEMPIKCHSLGVDAP